MWTFEYDPEGRLSSATPAAGGAIVIERDAQGEPTALIGPGGETTTLSTDATGWLETITNPVNQTFTLAYAGGDGLLTSFEDSEGGSATFTYDDEGRLLSASGPAGTQTFDRVEGASTTTVIRTSAEGLVGTYELVKEQTRTIARHMDDNGGMEETRYLLGGTSTVEMVDGTTVIRKEVIDQRWGTMAPRFSSTFTTPSGLTSIRDVSRVAVLSDPTDPFSVVSLTETTNLDGDVSTWVYDAGVQSFTRTSAGGLVDVWLLDELGRVVSSQESSFEPLVTTRDGQGRVSLQTRASESRSFSYAGGAVNPVATLMASGRHAPLATTRQVAWSGHLLRPALPSPSRATGGGS